ncbi:MAG: Holliday junction resolvase RuvX [Burkholderiales bacterium]
MMPPHPSRLTTHVPSGTVLAFDYGEKRIGVAVGEPALGIAHPVTTIEAAGRDAQLAAVDTLVAEWRPARFVVGLPLAEDGTEHEMTRRARRFGRQIESRCALPVSYVDERFSSRAATERLAGRRAAKADIDRAAAQIILQDYFDHASRLKAGAA